MADAQPGKSLPPRKIARLGVVLVACTVAAGLLYGVRQRWATSSPPASPRLAAALDAMQAERYEEALARFTEAESQGEVLPVPIQFDCAQAAIHLGKMTVAEKYLRAALADEPSHLEANELLCSLLRVEGRNWELRSFALAMMRQDVFSAANLTALTAINHSVEMGSYEETAVERFLMQGGRRANDCAARLSQARDFMDHNLDDQALPLLAGVVDEDPSQLDAQARLGYLLLKEGTPERFFRWWRALPKEIANHPEYWLVAGMWAEHQRDSRTAARCYWEVLRRHPDHPSATYRLSQVLLALDRQSDAKILAERAVQLAQLKTYVMEVRARPGRIRQVAELLESLGRRWEALGWSRVSIERNQGDQDWAFQTVDRLRHAVRGDSDLVPERLRLATQIDLSAFPVPTWGSAEPAPPDQVGPTVAGDVPSPDLAFEDSAQSAGISFSYFNGADPARAYMFEFSGGGVGALDFDADGSPDLYLTQGCPWPPNPNQREYVDRLFRNTGDDRFIDVTTQAGLFSPGYGQGVSAGDFDNDGMPDVYVANIGRNQLYRNNGDGTFTDVTSAAGISGNEWTISTLIADLNGDGQPDLYDVNYLGGPKVFTEVCYSNGKPIQCFPPQFPGEFDKVYQSLGDGRFGDVSQAAGVRLPDGKGMGIIAADFDNSQRLSLFITNDTTPNFFFLNQTQTPKAEIRFEEQAIRRGLALSESGRASSCMGIAAGDTNQDGLLDILVTNFQDEPNNLFVQGDGMLFEDRIRPSRLHDPSFGMEGWGAQFLDADLDGDLDLVVANGHLDDYPHSLGVNRMPTQVFRNRGEGRFAEVPAANLGPYFQKGHLGRAVVRLDWNSDGRPDVGVTHLHAPFALLTNRSHNPGSHFLTVHLRGVASARDAIGAKVTVRADAQEFSQQLIAGDGFQASNQRALFFGLGKADKVDSVRIVWPSGREQSHGPLAADASLLFIEGSSTPEEMAR